MKEYEVKMVFDLTKPEEANIYNSIRSLDGIKNAINNFKGNLSRIIDESEKIKFSGDNAFKVEFLKKIHEVNAVFEQSFKEQGINV